MLVNLSSITRENLYALSAYRTLSAVKKTKSNETGSVEKNETPVENESNVVNIYARSGVNLSRLNNFAKKLADGYTGYEYKNSGVELFKLDDEVKTQVVAENDSDIETLKDKYPRLKKLLERYKVENQKEKTEQTEQVPEIPDDNLNEINQTVLTERTEQTEQPEQFVQEQTETVITDTTPKRLKRILNFVNNNTTVDNTTTDIKENNETVAIESLGSSSQTQKVQNLSEEEMKTISGINGLIDEYVYQGNTGDCWLIGAVASLLSSEKGAQFIRDSIKVNDDYSVTVTFGGVGVSYTLTPAEITKHDTDMNFSDAYSNGDNDMLVFELATEKLLRDIRLGRITLGTDDINITYTGEGHGIDDGGLPSQTIYYMTGVESAEYYKDDMSNLDESVIKTILKQTYENENSALSFVVYGKDHRATLVDGSNYYLSVGTYGHVLSVTDIGEDTLTFVNPWNLSKEYKISYDEFAKLGIGYVCYSDLNKADVFDEIVDAASLRVENTTSSSGLQKLALLRS